ncbi:hypothetical protein, partial [Vibrio anguillarum]|uniref:hypothetical protein n=1 Tax=Vibrio anguillarum TaxID=55601 RepID=UPI001BE46A85
VAQPQLSLIVIEKRSIGSVSVALSRTQTVSPSKIIVKPPIGSVSVTFEKNNECSFVFGVQKIGWV